MFLEPTQETPLIRCHQASLVVAANIMANHTEYLDASTIFTWFYTVRQGKAREFLDVIHSTATKHHTTDRQMQLQQQIQVGSPRLHVRNALGRSHWNFCYVPDDNSMHNRGRLLAGVLADICLAPLVANWAVSA